MTCKPINQWWIMPEKTMAILITPAEPDDKDRLLTLMTQVIITSVTQDVELQKNYIENVTQNLDWWEDNPNLGCHLKAVSGQRVVGVVLVKKFWNLCSLFVAPKYQSQGIGRALVMAAIEECSSKSEKSAIILNAAPNAIPFYRAIGFVPREGNQPLPSGVLPMQLALEAPRGAASTVSIRSATSSDIPAIQALYRELDCHHVDLLPETFKPVDGDNRRDDAIAEWIVADNRVYIVAETDSDIVGFISVAEKSYGSLPMYYSKRYGHVDDAVVTAAHRKAGIGKQLFSAAVDWMRARGLQSVQVQVWNANSEAVEFYRKQGFNSIYTRMELDLMDAQPDTEGRSDGQ